MKISRSFRFVVAFVALFSMLFMQFAVVSYVCPDMSMAADNIKLTTMAVGDATSSGPNCLGMDKDQAGLCHAHAQDPPSKQSLDKPPLPDVQPFVVIGLVSALYDDFDALFVPRLPESLLLARSNAPPIAILNCCFRI